MAKRYIVTYASRNVPEDAAASILNVSSAALQDGVSLLATDAILSSSEVLHFRNLSSSSVQLSGADVARLKADPRILAVEEDLPMHKLEIESAQHVTSVAAAAATQTIPWNIQMVRAPQAWNRGFRGAGVKVAVLDTGIGPHPDLVVTGGVSFVEGVTSFRDGDGHGTHCAGIIAAKNNSIGVVGVAPGVSLFAVKVLDDTGSGLTTWILAGMAWARQNGMHIVSMSLGANACQSVAYNNAIAQLNAAGVTVVCAAGNSGSSASAFRCVNRPANSSGAIAVAAVDNNMARAGFSSFGVTCCPTGANPVTIAAPGVRINSTIPGGYGLKDGTSMACPHVAGAAALVKQRFPNFRPADIKRKLMSTATNLGAPGVDPLFGAGLVNCEQAIT